MEEKANKIEEKTIEDAKLKTATDRATERAKKKEQYLLNMQISGIFGRIYHYCIYNYKRLIALFFVLVFGVGILGGLLARLVWEIWRMIFLVSL